MKLKEWDEEEFSRSCVLHERCLKKTSRGKKLDIFDDIVPEFISLKNKNYTMSWLPGSPELAEGSRTNLGALLSSCLYDHIIVPLHVYPHKAAFDYGYALSRSRGCRIDFEQFIDLVKDGRLKLTLQGRPTEYSAGFYRKIFKACEQHDGILPPRAEHRYFSLFHSMHLRKLARAGIDARIKRSEGARHSEGWESPIWLACEKELRGILNPKSLEALAEEEGGTADELLLESTKALVLLRDCGLDGISGVALDTIRLDPSLGLSVLRLYRSFLIGPIDQGLLGISTYDDHAVNAMSFLKLVDRNLGVIWKDLLSSSPACSAVVSPQTSLKTVELYGDELIRFVDAHPESELKHAIKGISENLMKLDVKRALSDFEKFDEIITERFNKDIDSLSRKARNVKNLIRVGGVLVDASASGGTSLIGGAMIASGQFQWLPALFAGATAAKRFGQHILSSIKPKDVVRWWSDTWPFTNPGLPLVLWLHA